MNTDDLSNLNTIAITHQYRASLRYTDGVVKVGCLYHDRTWDRFVDLCERSIGNCVVWLDGLALCGESLPAIELAFFLEPGSPWLIDLHILLQLVRWRERSPGNIRTQ